MANLPIYGLSTSFISLMNVLGAFVNPNGITKNSNAQLHQNRRHLKMQLDESKTEQQK